MPRKNEVYSEKKGMGRIGGRYYNFPKSFFPSVLGKGFNARQKEEYSALIKYLKILSTTAIHYRPSFCKKEIDYTVGPSKDGDLVEMYRTLYAYLQKINDGNHNNEKIAKDFVTELYKENIRIFNAFYYGFLKYIKQYEAWDKENKLSHRLDESIRKVVPYCSEKEMGQTLGCLFDVLKWAPNDQGVFSYSLVKQSILEIIENNISAECQEENRLSPYICQNIMYEIAIREDDQQQKNQYLFDTIYKMDELKYKFLYKNIDNRVKRINDPQKMGAAISFELILQALKTKKTETLFIYVSGLFEILVGAFNEPGHKERISFDKCHESYSFVIGQIVSSIKYLQVANDMKSLMCLRVISDAYLKIFPVLQQNMDLLYGAYKNKQGTYRSLTNFQKEQLKEILDSEKFQEESEFHRVSYNIKKNIDYLYTSDYSPKEVEAKIRNLENKKNNAIIAVNDFSHRINEKYFSIIKPYIKSLIPEEIVNELYKENAGENHVTFFIRKNKLGNLVKKYKDLLNSVCDGVSIDLAYVFVMENALEDIVAHIVDAYRANQNKKEAYQEVVDFYEKQKEKDWLECFSSLTIESKNHTEVFENDKRSKDFAEMKTDTISSKISTNPCDTKVSKDIKFKILETQKVKQKNVIVDSQRLKREQREERKNRSILEAKNKLGDKADQYILSSIGSDSGMKNPLVVAVSPLLQDKETGTFLSNEAQEKITNLAKHVDFVGPRGKNGIKFCDGVFVLKIINAGGQGYRGLPKVRYLESGGLLLQYDSLTKKKHADKALKATIKGRKKPSFKN